MEMDLELKQIHNFTGTEQYHNVMGVNVTDGIAYLMENGYSWFITDSLVIIRMRFKNEEFLSVKLKLNGDKAKMVITDGNDKTLYEQKYEYTNVKKEVNLFFTDNVYMLAREY